ncbi:MAG: hypothetical protein JXB26_18765 [Candidatus Aminicenantes bacterium]|nr:hypothetical protein [Candidatus Aminicenantes bacterium]
MKEKTEKMLLLPVLLVVLFNGAFILYKLNDSVLFLKKIAGILGNYILGVHFYLFLTAVLVVVLYALLKKQGWRKGLRNSIFIFFLFICAVNWAWFEECNKAPYPKIEHYLLRKKTGSINEALALSPAHNALVIREYKKFNNILKGKKIILPLIPIIKNDYFFLAYVHPQNIVRRDYDPAISDEEYRKFFFYWKEMFIADARVKGCNRYRVVDRHNNAQEWILLSFEETILFVPVPLYRTNVEEK